MREENEELSENEREEIQNRIRNFLKSIPLEESEINIVTSHKRNIDNILIDEGIEKFIDAAPNFVNTKTFDESMEIIYKHYIKNKPEDMTEVDYKNINYLTNLYETYEEYEKCQKLVELYKKN